MAGCFPSEPLREGEIDSYWRLQADVWPKAERQAIQLVDRPLPSLWVFRQEPSLIWATVSMVRASDALEAGVEELDVAVSPAHAEMLAKIIAEVRRTVEQLRQISDPEATESLQQWSETLAEVLVSAEKITRVATGDERRARDKDDPLGWSAGPMIQMLAAYLNERAQGALLAGMESEDALRLREVLVQVVLRLGFAAAGKQDPPGLRAVLAQRMRDAGRPESLQQALAETLIGQLAAAPPAKPGDRVSSLLSTAFAIAPPMLELTEAFIRQWDRMESVSVEFRHYRGQPVASVTLRVKPGRTLRLAKMHFLQPGLAFRGSTRVTILPKVEGTEEMAVLFEPLEGGRAELLFEGPLYGLVKLLALPLADSALREIRVAYRTGPRGRLTSATILMEAIGDSEDPRRIMMFQDVRASRIERTAFEIRRVTERSEQTFNYLTPTRRYTYRRWNAPPPRRPPRGQAARPPS